MESESLRVIAEETRTSTFDVLVAEYNVMKADLLQQIADGTASVDALQVLESQYAAKALALETTYAPQLNLVKLQLAETKTEFQTVIAGSTDGDEVINARGIGNLTLKDRLDDSDAQLAEKADIKPIAVYRHNSNKEVTVSNLDIVTGTFTSVGHGLINGNEIAPTVNIWCNFN